MAMIKCPYCEMDIAEEAVENEDGCCPECGAMVLQGSLFASNNSSLYDDYDDDEELDDDFDDEL